jgi:hypothetical protein
MRRYSLFLLIVLLALAVGLGAVACDSGGSAGKTPQQLLTAAATAQKAAASRSGTYEIDLTLKADASQTTQTTAEGDITAALLGQPIKVTGTFAGQESPMLADATLNVGLMGINVAAGLRALGDKMWMDLLGQWYEIPADQLQQAGITSVADLQKTVKDATTEANLDITTWVKDLKTVGDETVADTQVTHLSGTIDFQKMITDSIALMQNPKIAALLASSSSAASTNTGVTVPDAASIAQSVATLQQVFKTATVDMWVAKSDSTMRKITLNLDLVIPTEMGLTGLSGGTVVATINLDAAGKAVTVAAPESAKPFSDLEKDMQSNPILSGFVSGFLGGGSDETTTTLGL